MEHGEIQDEQSTRVGSTHRSALMHKPSFVPRQQQQQASHGYGASWQRGMWRLVGFVLAGLMLMLRKTLSLLPVRMDPRPKLREGGKPYVCALRHQDLVHALLINDEPTLAAMLSGSHHGELMIPLFRARNVLPVRGSKRTGRRAKGGIAAVGQLAALAQQHIPVLLTVDGPKGPVGKVALGVVETALRSGGMIVPMTVQSNRTWFLPTWDRLQIPKPGAQLRLCIGAPIDPEQYVNRRLVQQAIQTAFCQLDEEARGA